jgi:hypothetical protein
MRQVLILVGAILFFSLSAMAQGPAGAGTKGGGSTRSRTRSGPRPRNNYDLTKWQVAIGYQYNRINLVGTPFNTNGLNTSVVRFFGRWIGLEGQMGLGYGNTAKSDGEDALCRRRPAPCVSRSQPGRTLGTRSSRNRAHPFHSDRRPPWNRYGAWRCGRRRYRFSSHSAHGIQDGSGLARYSVLLSQSAEFSNCERFGLQFLDPACRHRLAPPATNRCRNDRDDSNTKSLELPVGDDPRKSHCKGAGSTCLP